MEVQLVAIFSSQDSPRVVIVDESDECREVLHTLLATRGVTSVAARGAREGLELMKQYHPDVVVLDVDAEAADEAGIQQALDEQVREHHTELVILGKTRHYRVPLPDGQVLAKPYHYAPLLRTIEQLLARSSARSAPGDADRKGLSSDPVDLPSQPVK